MPILYFIIFSRFLLDEVLCERNAWAIFQVLMRIQYCRRGYLGLLYLRVEPWHDPT